MKNPFKKQEQKHYMITQFQVVYKDGSRDIVKLNAPLDVEDINEFRARKREEYNCLGINLTYMEL